jgi:hypothetical protein
MLQKQHWSLPPSLKCVVKYPFELRRVAYSMHDRIKCCPKQLALRAILYLPRRLGFAEPLIAYCVRCVPFVALFCHCLITRLKLAILLADIDVGLCILCNRE